MPFNIALSGIQAASSELGVIGNNVANGSTTGFKSSRAEFADVYAASGLGTSSLAIGSGTRLADVNQDFGQGTVNFTSKSLDLAINGQGFYRLNDGGTTVYSRAGSFNVDRDGFIVTSGNQNLTGFLADASGNITGAVGDLQVDTSNIDPVPTTSVTAGLNLPANDTVPASAWVGTATFGGTPPAPDTYNASTSTTIYDSLGNSHILGLFFIKTATANEWEIRAQVDGVDVDSSPASAPFTQVFNTNGGFNSGSSDAISLSWAPLDGSGAANGAVSPQVFSVDISDTTQFGSPFAVQALSQNGATTGRLDSIDVDNSGIIFGRYSNGLSRAMGQVTLSNFANPAALQPLGNTSWGETFGSGQPLTGEPGTASLGNIQSGALEDSNVDLTAELVKMILAQRNFQANAQTIRTADATTQTIINIR